MKKIDPLTVITFSIIGFTVFAAGEIMLGGSADKDILMRQEANMASIKKPAKKIKKKKIRSYSSAQATLNEIDKIKAAGTFLSEDHYYNLKKRLDGFAQQGMGGLEPYYQAIERLNPMAIAREDALRQAAGSMPPKQNCVSNTLPVFTHHITDMNAVNYIVPPPTMGSGPSLKPHGYIGTDHARVPVYAPADMAVKDGSYYAGGPYMFDFQVSCEVTVRFGHMTDPVDALKKLLPAEPAADSRTKELSSVSFKAGELVGYTTGTDRAGNWDYGVYNANITNRYAHDPDWGGSATYTTAVCPFDYFTPDLKAAYIAKFKPNALGGNPPHGESFCKF